MTTIASQLTGTHQYKYQTDITRRNNTLHKIWDKVYENKQTAEESYKNDAYVSPSKHVTYFQAFESLGFFEGLQKNSTLLQAGVGHGKTLRTIVERVSGVTPIGLDISFLALNRTKRNHINPLVQADILQLPFTDNSIDRAFEVGVVEHLYRLNAFGEDVVDRKSVVDSFIELLRVIKPKGQVAFIQPSTHSTLGVSKTIQKITNTWSMGFQEDFSIDEFAQLMDIAGFNNIRYSVLQAPDDFNTRIKVGDRLLRTYHTLNGNYKKAELTGALFAIIGVKL